MRYSAGLALLLAACSEDPPPEPERVIVHPHLAVRADQKESILARLNDAPFDALYARITARADNEFSEPEAGVWDWKTYNKNACISQANAFLAWLHDDPTRAEKPRQYFRDLATDYENHNSWDLNIRMPYMAVCGVHTWDFLMGSGFFPAEEASAAQDKLVHIAQAHFDHYVMDSFYRYTALEVTQNNHPLRTASTLALTGMAFPDAPGAMEWLGWALAEYDYLFSEEGHYIQAEGGVSEGPHYYFFGLPAVMAALIAADNGWDEARPIKRNCLSRNIGPPWNAGDCTETSFDFSNPLRRERFAKAMDWSMALRMGDGGRLSIADGGRHSPNGLALMAGYAEGKEHLVWDWMTNQRDELKTTGGMHLTIHHLAHLPHPLTASEPSWLNRFMPDSGYAVFRSGWDPQARLGVLMAEHGPARLTLHDHVDGMHFMLEAFGEYLVIDTGYYKPNELNNARTANAPAHNVILIDGQGAPTKGLLNDWGGADAYLENTHDGQRLAYAEARQRYQNTNFVRSMAFVGGRYFVIADRLTSDAAEAREHRWRVHAGVGRDYPGQSSFEGNRATLTATHARLEIALASPSGDVVFQAPPFVEDQAPYVHSINGHGHHDVLDGVISARQPSFLGVLLPSPTDDTSLTIEAVDAPEGSVAWRIVGGETDDLIWLRSGGVELPLEVNAELIQTDAELLILSGSDAGLMVSGSSLSVGGVQRVQLDSVAPVHGWEPGD
jgi:hypothetical protein